MCGEGAGLRGCALASVDDSWSESLPKQGVSEREPCRASANDQDISSGFCHDFLQVLMYRDLID